MLRMRRAAHDASGRLVSTLTRNPNRTALCILALAPPHTSALTYDSIVIIKFYPTVARLLQVRTPSPCWA